jgi:hypothetical protein
VTGAHGDLVTDRLLVVPAGWAIIRARLVIEILCGG